jgi:hypothetical protein
VSAIRVTDKSAPAQGWKDIAPEILEGAGVYEDDDGLVHLPCRNRDGEVLRERLFAPDDRRWWGPGEGIHLFGCEQLRNADPSTPIVISEGETDGLAAREHMRGFIAIACPGSSAFRSHWRALFEDFPHVYSVGDGGDAGRRFAWNVQKAVPWVRPVVCPPGRDLRSLLQDGALEVVEALLADAGWIAKVEYAVFNASDLEEAERWLEYGLPKAALA